MEIKITIREDEDQSTTVTIDEETTQRWEKYLGANSKDHPELGLKSVPHRIIHLMTDVVNDAIANVQRQELVQAIQQGKGTRNQIQSMMWMLEEPE